MQPSATPALIMPKAPPTRLGGALLGQHMVPTFVLGP